MIRGYRVRVERSADSFGAWSPDFPGAVGLGDTREDALQSIAEGMHILLECLAAERQPAPATWRSMAQRVSPVA